MSVTYEQFLTCLQNSAGRRLIGVEMSDDEATHLVTDSAAARAYFEVWSIGQNQSTQQSAAPASAILENVVEERVLLDISTAGRGGEPAKVRVTSERLFISTTGGVSAWKAFLGAATLGLSTAVTGINAGTGGDLDIPISAVTAAMITKTGMAYSTIKLVIGGDSVEFGIASVAARAVTDTINAATTGGARMSAAADAWTVYLRREAKQWPSERQLAKMAKRGQITQAQFENDAAISRALQSLSML